MSSGAHYRAARSDRARIDEQARELIPLRVSNLDLADQLELRALLADFFAGAIGDPDA
jgi:hypothetical protein